jgi:predicted YcjX-like family ATPase
MSGEGFPIKIVVLLLVTMLGLAAIPPGRLVFSGDTAARDAIRFPALPEQMAKLAVRWSICASAST